MPEQPNGVLASYTIVYHAENDPEITLTVPYNNTLVSLSVLKYVIIYFIPLDTISHHHWIMSLPTDQCHHHCY